MLFDALGMMCLGEYTGWEQRVVLILKQMNYIGGRVHERVSEWLWIANRL